MGWLKRRTARLRRGSGARRGNPIDDQTVTYLTEFVQTRRGVEGFIEMPTVVTEPTLLLVAYDGEWTRRRVPSPEWARSFAKHLQIPGYDAAVVGYPQRMRDYNHRQKIAAQRKLAGES
jgi:hypothetical protein